MGARLMHDMDLEDLGGEEIAEDFTRALVNVIENNQPSIMSYDLDMGVYIRITVEPLTKEEFEADPTPEKIFS